MNIYRGRSHTEVYLASVLYDSIEDHDISSVRKLLEEKGADPNLVLPRKGISSFHLIIGNNSEDFAMEVCSLIIQNGGNPNVPSDEGLTPVHIAAAWGRLGILKLLLNCGGDPELTDNCYKTALHYAVDEGWKEIAAFIQEYIDYQRCAVYNNYDAKPSCTIVLDKVLLNNGLLVGEYEVQTLEKDVVPKMDLNSLPQTDSQEYVLSWCNNQELSYDSRDFSEEYLAELECGNTAFIGSKNNTHSPKDLSIPSNYRNKASSPSILNSISSLSSNRKNAKQRFKNVTIRNKNKPYTNIVSRDICKYKESSRESGILTLQDSSENDSSGGNSEYSDSDMEKENNYLCNNSKCIKGLKNRNTKDNKDTSSDYCTCTEGSETTNPLVCYVPKSDKVKSNSSNSDDQDISFVSVSEVYKYTDTEENVVLYEKRILVASVNSSQNESISTQSSLPKIFDYDTDTLRKELTTQGFDPGPITKTTKRVYLRKLRQLKKHPQIVEIKPNNRETAYSPELQRTLTDLTWCQNLSHFKYLEDLIRREFCNPDPSRKWREGITKSSFTYLLLDPRTTRNLPHRYDKLEKQEVWETFLSSIFYVGKGKRSRPFSHLYSAINIYNKGGSSTESKKISRILDIWKDNHGVICLHVFQNVIPVEAYTREAAMISAINLGNITNNKVGDFYGVSATWSKKQRNLLGVYLLYKAMKIFLHEGERQLFPNDID